VINSDKEGEKERGQVSNSVKKWLKVTKSEKHSEKHSLKKYETEEKVRNGEKTCEEVRGK